MFNWRFPFILAVSFLLLFINLQNKRPHFKVPRTSHLIRNHIERMRSIQSKDDFALSRAFILGDKRSLTKKLKLTFSRLHTNHLFTPSGIHFSSFFILFLPLIRKCRNKGLKKTSLLIELTLCLLPFGLSQFYSLKRISILRISNLILKKAHIKVDIFYVFLISFLLDFIFGTYKYSPISFTFSFLFLGSLLSTPKLSSMALSFFTANLLLTIFLPTTVSFSGFFLGFLLTSIFSFLFPFYFLSYWMSSLIQIDLAFPFLYIIKHISDLFFNLSSYSFNFEIDILGLICIFLFSKVRKLRYLIFALIISSSRIYNVPDSRIKLNRNEYTQDLKNWKILKGVEKSQNKNISCRRKILVSGHQIRCRKKKKRE
mgnify:CR=1 FL=1